MPFQDQGTSRADLRATAARRAKGFARFSDWQSAHRPRRTPQDALSAATWLYDLLPADSRRRPVQTSGVAALHRRLSVLSRRR